ncbi:hypothetical protein ID855_10820 [Xenorhabdus sp. ZM]|uniref:hypothetical protein n=1 Tax=Xenorhabdus szentirmaii TaxID=290112 RepID=UPI0019860FE6|nr:hypothetical protein [Xenorhabdus sp. ZM]MBD2805178.1 hypothetical protein [Xenorhabdus sp. ZM]
MKLPNSKNTHDISFEIDSSKMHRMDHQDGVKCLFIQENVMLRNSNNELKDDFIHASVK